MSSNDSERSQVDHPKDEDVLVALTKRVEALEVNVRRADRKLKDIDVFRAVLALALAVAGFIVTLALAISPYLGLAHLPVPQIISYVSAFAVLFFAYLTYVAYGNAVASRELRRATRYAVEDGRSALLRAHSALEMAWKEQTNAS